MSVKSKMLDTENTKPITYPVIMRWKATGEVILFKDATEGTVIVKGSGHNVGYHSKAFNNILTDRGWERIQDGVGIVLTNEPD